MNDHGVTSGWVDLIRDARPGQFEPHGDEMFHYRTQGLTIEMNKHDREAVCSPVFRKIFCSGSVSSTSWRCGTSWLPTTALESPRAVRMPSTTQYVAKELSPCGTVGHHHHIARWPFPSCEKGSSLGYCCRILLSSICRLLTFGSFDQLPRGECANLFMIRPNLHDYLLVLSKLDHR